MARRECPSTNRFYRLSDIMFGTGAAYTDFRHRVISPGGRPTVESSLTLDLQRLFKTGWLKADARILGLLQWTLVRTGEEAACQRRSKIASVSGAKMHL